MEDLKLPSSGVERERQHCMRAGLYLCTGQIVEPRAVGMLVEVGKEPDRAAAVSGVDKQAVRAEVVVVVLGMSSGEPVVGTPFGEQAVGMWAAELGSEKDKSLPSVKIPEQGKTMELPNFSPVEYWPIGLN